MAGSAADDERYVRADSGWWIGQEQHLEMELRSGDRSSDTACVRIEVPEGIRHMGLDATQFRPIMGVPEKSELSRPLFQGLPSGGCGRGREEK